VVITLDEPCLLNVLKVTKWNIPSKVFKVITYTKLVF